MFLNSGTSLGSYEILAPIGAGGMGEVYRARDTKLKREVALKVLPEAFAGDSDRMIRFQREAEFLASLNHPKIAHIYGVEERALAMELVEGQTLAGPLPIETALHYARQIAEALEYAHDRGVIHRDLKPANIKITPEGVVKLLDFGLAKATEDPSPPSNASNSPTLTLGATSVGVILGTAAYMSPEQASGKVADRRSDIWSFGAVLYEMLTGKQPFAGESVSDTLATVMKVEPDWSAVPKDAPTSIHKLIRRCLTKDRKQRLQAIGEARIVLENPLRDEPALTAPVTSRLSSRLGWASAALLAMALAVLAFIHLREQTPVERMQRYTIALPENSSVHSFAISPDARYVVVAAMVNGKQQLWLRPLDALEAQPMQSTEDATYPFLSPDSRYIGFFAQNKLKKIAAGGGPAQSLCDVQGARGGSWNQADVILFSGNVGTGLQRVPAAGGVPPTDVRTTNGSGSVYRYPAFLPDGRHFLYTDIRSLEAGGIYVGSLDGVERRRVLSDRSAAVFAPSSPGSRTGHLLFVRENNLMALPFDATAAQASGDVFPVAERVSISLANAGYAPVTSSENGVLLYWTGNAAAGTSQMVWYDRTGKFLGTVGPPGQIFVPAISPDEKRIAFTRAGGGFADIWLRDLVRATDTRLTAGGVNFAPSWSPKGDRILFSGSGAGGGFGSLYQKAASGPGQADLLLSSLNSRSDQWSRDGRFVVYTRADPKTKEDLWILPLGETGSTDRMPFAFLQTEFNESQGQLSPNGRWMAYTSDESGQREVYVRPFPPGDGKWTISTAGGEQPRWRGDGKELLYATADGKIMAVTVKAVTEPKPSFEPDAPVPLFDSHMVPTNANNLFQYDVTADGKRFLVVTNSPAPSSAPPLIVSVNWSAGFKK